MKTATKKKYCTVAVVLLSVLLFSTNKMYKILTMSEDEKQVLANIEALTDGEGASDTWTCWSELRQGYGVWVCGNPCEWKEDRGGKSGKSTCTSKSW